MPCLVGGDAIECDGDGRVACECTTDLGLHRGQCLADAALADADVLVCPADPTLAPKVGEASRLGGRERMWFEYGTVNLGNLTGAPALSLPCGFTPDRLPVGLQLYGRAFDEATLLAFAQGYELGTEWHARRPPGV